MKPASAERFSPIGIDHDERELRAAQFERSGGVSTLRSVVVLGRSGEGAPGEEELGRLRGVLARRGFVGDETAIAPASDACAFHILELPPEDSGAPIDELTRVEIVRSGAHESGDIQFGGWALPGGRRGTRFVSSVETERVSEAASGVERAGFVVTRVTPSAMAMFRAASDHERIEDGSINAVLGIGWRRSEFVVSIGTTPVYTRRIEHGAACVLGGGAQAGGARGLVEDLGSNLDSAFSYVSQLYRTEPFGVTLCSGYLADDERTLEALASRIALPVSGLARAGFGPGTEVIEPTESDAMTRLNTACGLALGGAA